MNDCANVECIDGHAFVREERLFIFPIYLGMTWFVSVVYVRIHKEGFPGFGGGEDAGHALPCSQPQVWHTSRWVLLRWNFFWSQVHFMSWFCKHSNYILISGYK